MFFVRFSVCSLQGGANGVGYSLAGRSRDVHSKRAGALSDIFIHCECRACRRHTEMLAESDSNVDGFRSEVQSLEINIARISFELSTSPLIFRFHLEVADVIEIHQVL
jgi:hypothetical protein